MSLTLGWLQVRSVYKSLIKHEVRISHGDTCIRFFNIPGYPLIHMILYASPWQTAGSSRLYSTSDINIFIRYVA